jgi:uncharacterized protein YbjQ (UPF0145 family)
MAYKCLEEAVLMIVTTTPSVDGYRVKDYLGIVAGEVALGTSFVRDMTAALADFLGARTTAYEEKLVESRTVCIKEMCNRAQRLGADAVIGVKLDHEILANGMMLVLSSGTAVRLVPYTEEAAAE